MEAGLSSLLERGDKVIICVNGFFCERQILMCERLGIEVVRVDAPYGQTVDPQRLEDALTSNPDTKLVSAIHAETSAGTLQDIGTSVCPRSRPRCVVHDGRRHLVSRDSG